MCGRQPVVVLMSIAQGPTPREKTRIFHVVLFAVSELFSPVVGVIRTVVDR